MQELDIILVSIPDQLAFAFFPRKCVESSGASAKATAVSPTVFQQLRGHYVKLGILRRG
jgi:hypothetical protein